MKKTLKLLKKAFFLLVGLVLLIVVPIGLNKLYEAIRTSTLSPQEKLLEDIDRLEYLVKNEYGGYHVYGKEQAFEAQLAYLRELAGGEEVPDLPTFRLEAIKAVATLTDPHAVVYNIRHLFTEYFPYRLEWYDGSFYLTGGQVDEQWLGARITSFNGTPPAEVFRKLAAYTFSPNDHSSAYFFSFFQALPDVYYHEGIIDDPTQIALDLELPGGETTTAVFQKMSSEAINGLPDYVSLAKKYADKTLPLWKQKPGVNYWYQYLEAEQTFYLRYAMCVDQGNIESFWQEVFTKLDEWQPQKFVLDIRRNPGGDSQNHVSFLHGIAKHPLNQPGKMYTIIDRGTGSAAVGLAVDMERLTHAVLVGEKTIDRPNTTSDPTFFTLPHSKLTLLVPNLFALHSHIGDTRDAVIPDIPISEWSSGSDEDYHKDRALAYIIDADPSPEVSRPADLPGEFSGSYTFSPIRNIELRKLDDRWVMDIEGLTRTTLQVKDSSIVSDKLDIEVMLEQSSPQALVLRINDQVLTANRVTDGTQPSLLGAILARDFSQVGRSAAALKHGGKLPHYLDRPFFQARTYEINKREGFEQALAFNEQVKTLFPDDPVLSIVDFELYQYAGKPMGQINSIFPVIGKLLKRYYRIVTTDRVMNDQYNAFIGK